MDRYWNVPSFCPPSYSEREFWQGHSKRKIQSGTRRADGACRFDTLYDDRFYGERRYPFPVCACFSAYKRRAFFGEKSAYDLRLLGICADVGSSWVSLEHDAGNGKETFSGIVCGAEVDRAYSGDVISGYGIYAFIKRDIGDYMFLRSHFVFFDYEEPPLFFYMDYIAVMGLFIFLGYYICAGLRMIGRERKTKVR